MIDRYTREEIGAVWSEQAKFDSWLKVELAVCDALFDADVIPAAYLSESHQDTLAICVLLALAKRQGDSHAILLLDDVLILAIQSGFFFFALAASKS